MPFNLDTNDETGRDLAPHRPRRTASTYSTKVRLVTTDDISQYVIEDRLAKFIHNLGSSVEIIVDIDTTHNHHLDNLDF